MADTADTDGLNFDALRSNMVELSRMVSRYNGRSLMDANGKQTARTAEQMRDLRRMEDLLRASQVIVNNEMWLARGYEDMLGVE